MDWRDKRLNITLPQPSISLKYHRPNVIPFTADMVGYLQALEEASGTTPTDRTLAAWVRLQHIIDLSAAALGLRSRTVKADLAEEKTWLDLQNCARQLISWRQNLPSDIVNGQCILGVTNHRSDVAEGLFVD